MAVFFNDDFVGSSGSVVGRTVDGLTWINGLGSNGSFLNTSYSDPPNLDGSGNLRVAGENFSSAACLPLPAGSFDGDFTAEWKFGAVDDETQGPPMFFMALHSSTTDFNGPTLNCSFSSGQRGVLPTGASVPYTVTGFGSHTLKWDVDFVGGTTWLSVDGTPLFTGSPFDESLINPAGSLRLTLWLYRPLNDPALVLDWLKLSSGGTPEPPSPSDFWTGFVNTREVP